MTEAFQSVATSAVRDRGRPDQGVEGAAFVHERFATDSRGDENPGLSAHSAARTGCPCHSAMASRSVARARGCAGSWRNCAFKIGSCGPARATTRVVARPGAIPIQIDSMWCFLAARHGLLHGGRALRDRHHRRRAKFSTTRVRFYFSLSLTPASRACRGLPLGRRLLPVRPLRLLAPGGALSIVPAIRAVLVATVAWATEIKRDPALVINALGQP